MGFWRCLWCFHSLSIYSFVTSVTKDNILTFNVMQPLPSLKPFRLKRVLRHSPPKSHKMIASGKYLIRADEGRLGGSERDSVTLSSTTKPLCLQHVAGHDLHSHFKIERNLIKMATRSRTWRGSWKFSLSSPGDCLDYMEREWVQQ